MKERSHFDMIVKGKEIGGAVSGSTASIYLWHKNLEFLVIWVGYSTLSSALTYQLIVLMHKKTERQWRVNLSPFEGDFLS
jgi:hypothetical protein